MEERENKYQAGDIVYAKLNQNIKLIVRRYTTRIYYCKVHGKPNREDLVYFERELFDKSTKIIRDFSEVRK